MRVATRCGPCTHLGHTSSAAVAEPERPANFVSTDPEWENHWFILREDAASGTRAISGDLDVVQCDIGGDGVDPAAIAGRTGRVVGQRAGEIEGDVGAVGGALDGGVCPLYW